LRTFELLLVLAAVGGVAHLLAVRKPGQSPASRLIWPTCFLLVLLAQVLIEGSRWQLYPLYLVTVSVGVAHLLRSRTLMHRAGMVLTLLLAVTGGFLAYALPVL